MSSKKITLMSRFTRLHELQAKRAMKLAQRQSSIQVFPAMNKSYRNTIKKVTITMKVILICNT